MPLRFLGALFAAAIATAPAMADDCRPPAVGYRVLQLAGKAVAVWYPTTAAAEEYHYAPNFSGMVALDASVSRICGKPAPLVVFSHGDLGCALQSIALTEELARRGYIVAAPDHADALLCHTIPSPPPQHQPPQPNVFKPDTWDDTTFADRRRDIADVIDALLTSSEFGPAVDPQNIGLAGHSLGGYTVVGVAGGWPTWLDRRIRAVLALSPYVMPFQVRKTLGDVRVPLMYQGGTLDIGITPFLKGDRGAYHEANPPAYFVELKDAGHFAWANCGSAHSTASCLATKDNFRLIDEYAIAFFNKHLKQAPEPILARRNPAVAAFEFKLPAQ
jgi:predicted dienelactone hydrolase